MDEINYRTYVSDALFAIVNNTARFAGGSSLKKRYWDIISEDFGMNNNKQEDPFDILERAGIEVID